MFTANPLALPSVDASSAPLTQTFFQLNSLVQLSPNPPIFASMHATDEVTVIEEPRLSVGPSCKGRPATIVGTQGADRLRGTAGSDVILARGGDDHVFGLAGSDLLCGGAGDDRLRGNRGADRIFGQTGADQIEGGRGRDGCNGGGGHRDTQRSCEAQIPPRGR